ncbi:MAG: four helix bundle protein [Succinivibrionaceae bacterium]|nr:four helix bundle protein [Succinivibrionaceae bacterium]
MITRAKELCSYIMLITQKSPKQFRFSYTARLQNEALNILEYIIRANETRLDPKYPADIIERSELQRKAMTELVVLGYMSMLAMKQRCILNRQFQQISALVTDCRCLLGAWIKRQQCQQ